MGRTPPQHTFARGCSSLSECLTTVWHNFQANTYVLKEEQYQVVLGLLEQKVVVAVLPTGSGKSLTQDLLNRPPTFVL